MNTDSLLDNRKEIKGESIYETLSRASIGTRLDFQLLLKREYRITMELIGIDDEKTLILKLPKQSSSVEFSDFKTGSPGVIRLLLEGVEGLCLAFRTEVISTVTYPSKLIFFKFPKQIQTLVLRKERRVDVHYQAKVNIIQEQANTDAVELSGHIIDLSPNGCKFKTQSCIEPSLKRLATLSMKSNNGKLVKSTGVIKNSRLFEDYYLIGIQFKQPGDGLSFMFDDKALAC